MSESKQLSSGDCKPVHDGLKPGFTQIPARVAAQALADPSHYAHRAAEQSRRVAQACVDLGAPGNSPGQDARHSRQLWEANLAQIRMVEELYGLKPIKLEYPYPKNAGPAGESTMPACKGVDESGSEG